MRVHTLAYKRQINKKRSKPPCATPFPPSQNTPRAYEHTRFQHRLGRQRTCRQHKGVGNGDRWCPYIPRDFSLTSRPTQEPPPTSSLSRPIKYCNIRYEVQRDACLRTIPPTLGRLERQRHGVHMHLQSSILPPPSLRSPKEEYILHRGGRHAKRYCDRPPPPRPAPSPRSRRASCNNGIIQ